MSAAARPRQEPEPPARPQIPLRRLFLLALPTAAFAFALQAVLTVAGGNVVMVDGLVLGSGGTLITTPQGTKKLQAESIQADVANLADSLFYNAPEI